MINGTEGFQCTGAYADGNELNFQLKRNTPDVVLVDIEMPGISGIEAVKSLNSSSPLVSKGNGLYNMKKRAEDNGRTFQINSSARRRN